MGTTLSIKQTAKLLGISDSTLRRWLKSDNSELQVPHWRSGPRKDYKFDSEDVLKWKQNRKVSAETQKENGGMQD